MTINAKIGEKQMKADMAKVDAALKAMATELSQDLGAETGAQVVEKIRDRVAKGNKLPGGKFRRYAPSTVEIRKAAGLQISPVNLSFSGDMLGSLHYKKKGKSGVVSVDPGQAQKAVAHQFGTGKIPARPWMGLTRKDAKAIGGALGRRTTKIIKRHQADAYITEGKGYEGSDDDILIVRNP